MDYTEVARDIIKNNNLNFPFYNKFESEILLLFYLFEELTEDTDIHSEKEDNKSVVYLILCSLAIIFSFHKSEYKILFEELRLRDFYKYLKPSILIITFISNLASDLNKSIGGGEFEYLNLMFKNPKLLAPLLIATEIVSKNNNLKVDDFINCFEDNKTTYPLDFNSNIGEITVNNFLKEVFDNIKNFQTDNREIKKLFKGVKEKDYTEIFKKGKGSENTNNRTIKKYSEFELLSESEDNKYVEIERKWGSIGNFVEEIAKELLEDEDKLREFRRILGEYLDSEPTINISNAVNMINKYDQRLLVDDIENRVLEEVISENIVTDEYIEDVSNVTIAGKSCFNSFIKAIKAMNLEDIRENTKDVPNTFFKYYTFDKVNGVRAIKVFSRFRSLKNAVKLMEEKNVQIMGLYFGLKKDNRKIKLEYGVILNKERFVLGEFNFNTREQNFLMSKKCKALEPLKDVLKGMNLKEIKYLMKIKDDLKNFEPGTHIEKTNIYIQDYVLNIGFYGLGKWENGSIEDDSLVSLKRNFKKWVNDHKWRNEVLVSVKADKLWVYFKLKLDN